ncbi:hypothetical protein GCM10010201_21020 [Pilimelia columellifera subsp. columellifera]|uniref:Uncharacterized protein n=1 Tax=Pilimelia columellifera subsp. columellifera TaxID=706583 RepID=A0ABN3NMB3_9ACTN
MAALAETERGGLTFGSVSGGAAHPSRNHTHPADPRTPQSIGRQSRRAVTANERHLRPATATPAAGLMRDR